MLLASSVLLVSEYRVQDLEPLLHRRCRLNQQLLLHRPCPAEVEAEIRKEVEVLDLMVEQRQHLMVEEELRLEAEELTP